MAALVTPNKVVQFCCNILKGYCDTSGGNIVIKAHDLNPESFYLEGGEFNIAVGAHGRKVPVVKMLNGFWIHFSLVFRKKKKSNGNSHLLNGLSIQVFRGSSAEINLLFRAEWDNKEENEHAHPQPHWHFHPEIKYAIDGDHFDNETFKTYLELINRDGFEKELNKDEKKMNSISSFHFAMASRWQDKQSAVIPLTETNLLNWLYSLLQNINVQLEYSFN